MTTITENSENGEKSENSKEEYEIKTVPQDARYHNCNCSNWCMDSFVDYHKCIRLLGEENECCEQFCKIYKTICPNDWVRRWEDQISSGTFPITLPPKRGSTDKETQ